MNIETTKLTLYLNGSTVLNDVSLNIPNESVTTIVGPNGSGKSSLLEVFTGELGNFVGKLTKISRESISYLPQSLDSPPFLTLNEIISLGFYGQRIDKKIKDQHIERLMKICGIESLRTRNIIDVSEGEKQRTWLAFSLAQQKNIIMWDEPLSKIDDHGKRFFAKLIRSLADEGKTVITVSHDNESIEYSDHIIFLEKGNLLFQGSVTEYQDFFSQR